MFTPRMNAAFDYAADCHAGHVRKGTRIPCLSHLVAVAGLVMEAAADGEADPPAEFEVRGPFSALTVPAAVRTAT